MGAPLGNQNAAKPKEWEGAIKRALARRGEGDFRRGLDKIAEKVLDKAEEGDSTAWQEVGNRFDGKPKQSTEISQDPDSPVFPSLADLDALRRKIRGESA